MEGSFIIHYLYHLIPIFHYSLYLSSHPHLFILLSRLILICSSYSFSLDPKDYCRMSSKTNSFATGIIGPLSDTITDNTYYLNDKANIISTGGHVKYQNIEWKVVRNLNTSVSFIYIDNGKNML